MDRPDRATPSGGRCVLDWENAGPGDPSQELAVVLFEYCSGRPDRARELHDAYVGSGGPGRVTGRGSFSMAIAQLGHILAWQGESWLRAQTPEARTHAAGAIDEFVQRPLTRDVVDELVDAVA